MPERSSPSHRASGGVGHVGAGAVEGVAQPGQRGHDVGEVRPRTERAAGLGEQVGSRCSRAVDDLEVRGVVVVALGEAGIVGRGTEHRDPTEPRRVEGNRAVVVDEHEGLQRCASGEAPSRVGAERRRRRRLVDERVLEQPERERVAQDAAHGEIDHRLGHHARLDERRQLGEAVERRELLVEPGDQRLRGRHPLGGCDPVVGPEQVDREVVGHDGAVEAELVAEQLGQQRPRPGGGEPVDRRVAVHHRRQIRVADRGGERLGVDLAQLARAEVHGCVVHPALGRRVAEEVLAGGDHAVAQMCPLGSGTCGELCRPRT